LAKPCILDIPRLDILGLDHSRSAMNRIRKNVEAMQGYVPGEQPFDTSVVKLNTNENPYPPSPKVLEAIQALTENQLRKYPNPSAAALREAIAALHGVLPEQVIVGNGSDEVLALCTRAFVHDGGRTAWFDPSYSLYPVLAKIADSEALPLPLGPNFSWQVPDEIDADLFFITDPNAPTSLLHDLDNVAALADRYPGVILLDEAYADFAERNGMALVDQHDNIIVSRTLSKSYSLAAMRIGYAVGPVKLIQALHKIRDSYNMNLASQAAGLAAITDQAWMKANTAKIIATRTRLRNHLINEGWDVAESHTNFLWMKPPSDQKANEIFDHLYAQKIFIRYFPGERTRDWMRVSVGTDAEMDAFLNGLPK